jgi:hypothetical protein
MFRRRMEEEVGVRAAQVGGAGDAAGPPGFRAGSQPRHHGERKARIITSGADPRSGAFLSPGSEMGKNQDPDPG